MRIDSEQDFYLGKQQIEQSKLSIVGMQQAQAEVLRKKALIAPALQDEITNLIDGQGFIADQLAQFEDDFAINAPLIIVGKAGLHRLRIKDNKTPKELSQLAFWEGERELMLKLRNDLFGGAVTTQDDALLAELSINETDNSDDVRRKLIRSLAIIQKRLKTRRKLVLLQTGGTRDIGEAFEPVDTQGLMSQLGATRGTPEGTLAPGAVAELPPGFTPVGGN